MYKPVEAQRLFTFDTKYSEIDWNNFHKVVEAFKQQMEYWYILPAIELKEEGHFGFPVAALTCLLIDTLSQFEAGLPEGTNKTFKEFLRKYWPDLAVKFPTPIQAQFSQRQFQIEDSSDAIYHGLRCGILHEAHVKLYTGLAGQPEIAKYHASGLLKYSNGSDCPVVTINPGALFDAIKVRFDNYIAELLDSSPSNDDKRNKFKLKFESSYGVSINTQV